MKFWFYLCLFFCSLVQAEEKALTHVRQLTSFSMGFEKAGEAYFSPDGTTIIFQAVPESQHHYQIYTMKLDDGVPIMVSTGKGTCTCAYFRPDGQKILFASSHESPIADRKSPENQGKYRWDFTPYMNIYEANPDGTSLTLLTTGAAYCAECAYSPDGSQIVYASNRDGSMNLYVMKADGSHVRQITHTSHCYNGGPFFSPDGRHIVFRADRDRADYLQLFLIGSDGSGEKQLTFNEAVNWAPYWHPSGEVIAYTTSLHGHHQYQIYLMNLRTGVQYRLTDHPSFNGLPSFSPDGQKILWTSKRADHTSQIFIADFTMPEELR